MFVVPENLTNRSRFFKSFPKPCLLKKIRKSVKGVVIFQKVPLNKMLLNNLGYHQAVSEVFRRHLQNEYEIQLRCGKITEAGNEVIKALADDYKILQIEEEVENILNDETTKYLGSRHLIKLFRACQNTDCRAD